MQYYIIPKIFIKYDLQFRIYDHIPINLHPMEFKIDEDDFRFKYKSRKSSYS